MNNETKTPRQGLPPLSPCFAVFADYRAHDAVMCATMCHGLPPSLLQGWASYSGLKTNHGDTER